MVGVLVVDDAADIRLLVQAVLTRAGCRVREAASAAGAFAAIDEALPDVVLLDVQMPDADGWSVLATIRSDPQTASLPVVLCTVKGHPDDRAHGWRLGCDGYLTKPFTIPDLVDQVMAVTRRTNDERDTVRQRALHEIAELERTSR
jgi:DNA-binding response OmpR family regulator